MLQAWSILFKGEITSFSKTMLLQRELFFTMLYTIMLYTILSIAHYKKKCFIQTIFLSNNQKCSVPLILDQSFSVPPSPDRIVRPKFSLQITGCDEIINILCTLCFCGEKWCGFGSRQFIIKRGTIRWFGSTFLFVVCPSLFCQRNCCFCSAYKIVMYKKYYIKQFFYFFI